MTWNHVWQIPNIGRILKFNFELEDTFIKFSHNFQYFTMLCFCGEKKISAIIFCIRTSEVNPYNFGWIGTKVIVFLPKIISKLFGRISRFTKGGVPSKSLVCNFKSVCNAFGNCYRCNEQKLPLFDIRKSISDGPQALPRSWQIAKQFICPVAASILVQLVAG